MSRTSRWRAEPVGLGAVVLLAAGSGRRMLPLTSDVPKALLPVGDRSGLDWMIDAVLLRSGAEIVVVTGHAQAAVERHLSRRYGTHVRCAHNAEYERDVNIVSVETGVSALTAPDQGYLICETDLLLDDIAWDTLFARLSASRSQWICRGRYGPSLTGGMVHVAADGQIDVIGYEPRHDARFDGWDKMLGMLWVAPDQVEADRRTRRDAMAVSIAQYYLSPWQQQLAQLPCEPLRVDAGHAATFNTPAEFERAASEFVTRRRESTRALTACIV